MIFQCARVSHSDSHFCWSHQFSQFWNTTACDIGQADTAPNVIVWNWFGGKFDGFVQHFWSVNRFNQICTAQCVHTVPLPHCDAVQGTAFMVENCRCHLGTRTLCPMKKPHAVVHLLKLIDTSDVRDPRPATTELRPAVRNAIYLPMNNCSAQQWYFIYDYFELSAE